MQSELTVFRGLGPALRLLRERVAGLTQTEVSDRCGIAQNRLSRYENGRQIPDVVTLDRLLRAYGADAEGFGRALKEAQGAPAAPASDPELTARVRAALVELGFLQHPAPNP